jgi:hypothetical protein
MAARAAATSTAPPEADRHLLTRGHDHAIAAIVTMLSGPPHALLIGGPAGVGKTTLAMDLAAGLLCDDPDAASRPCRACRTCRLVDRGIHPDVHRLAPSGPGGQIRIGDRDRPDAGTVRRLIADLVLMPVEGGARVAIVESADRLTDDAQTALLKTLEEPPAGVTIVLCADDEDRLMPTVRSRCQRIRLGPVGLRDIETILTDAAVADGPTANRLARLSAGRPGLARTLAAAPDAVTTRDEIGRTLLDLLGAPIAARLAAARDLASRSAELARAIDRGRTEPAGSDGSSSAGRRPSRRPASAPLEPASEAPSEAPIDGSGDTAEEAAGEAVSATAADRRRATHALIGVWRDVVRDLALVRLGDERRVRDPVLLDDLRSVAGQPGAQTVDELAAQLRRLDDAGEMVEGNVRPELILDSLLLAWTAGREAG